MGGGSMVDGFAELTKSLTKQSTHKTMASLNDETDAFLSHLNSNHYEQPTNELVRASLKIEHLYNQALYNLPGKSHWDSHNFMMTYIEVLNLLDRPDLKSKFTQEIARLQTKLNKYLELPNVDSKRLRNVLRDLEDTQSAIKAIPGKLAQNLRDEEFVANIRQHLSNPSGTCNFDSPVYYYWLNLPHEHRQENMKVWLEQLTKIKNIAASLLGVIRDSEQCTKETAENGFFQQVLTLPHPIQLVSVTVPDSYQVYPEISIGRHRLCIRFITFDTEKRSQQTKENIPFELSVCSI